jgi:hypothetical protein
MVFDGTFLFGRRGLFAAMDLESTQIVFGDPDTAEVPPQLVAFCQKLQQRGMMPKSATIDGNPHVFHALRFVWPELVIQRCLVHIQRQGLWWCRRHPKRLDAQILRTLFLQVLSIRTIDDRDQFLLALNSWELRYGKRIVAQPERGPIFSDLKRARSMLLAAVPNMFHFLEDASIAKSTNALEGYFGRFKQRYRQHRGLSRDHQIAYIKWYLQICPR